MRRLVEKVVTLGGHTGESEALEHRLEHIIVRKQEQIDALVRASRCGQPANT